ncbi:tetratricopeptide repeat protein [Chryseobacterium polytrichastri]|uniref:Regulatory protein, luxR family n=1 Tax=Chryseobacterium polytrichastri TaxID=1302687 RepID=A0A1M6WAY8_9FLAO|nr:LuxR C-terminal-related transcriptional regulator [Chryseobacterium polytrichastri]SHK90904.1 regulatory protein, luxR family [Chryseobacterium polytrichastri]
MFLKKYQKKTLYVLILLFIVNYEAQVHSIKELDSLTEKYRMEGNIKKSIELNLNALKQYERQGNKDGIAASYINMSGLFWNLHKYKESLKYLENAEEQLRKITNLTLCAKMYGEYARNYASLGLLDQSNSSLTTSIHFAKQITEKKEREKLLYFFYTWKLANFEELGEKDSIQYVLKKRMELTIQPLTYVYIAENFIKNKKTDSAEYYLNKATKISGDFSHYQKSMTLLTFGKLYTEKKDPEKALDYYLQSLSILQQISRKNDIKNVYKIISDTYGSLNNPDKKNEYLEKYSAISDSIKEAERQALRIPVDKIINEEKEREKNERTKYLLLISVLIVASIIIVIIVTRRYIKKQKQAEEIIIESLHETDELKSKLNEAFEELSKLAMTNDPFFLTRFKEIYPDFYETLITKYPNLSANDIKFSAFLKLNLSTKTIAQYKNISIRTIESRKYRLRKKLDLPSDVDLNKWMMEL